MSENLDLAPADPVLLPSCIPAAPFQPSPAFVAWLETLLPPMSAELKAERAAAAVRRTGEANMRAYEASLRSKAKRKAKP